MLTCMIPSDKLMTVRQEDTPEIATTPWYWCSAIAKLQMASSIVIACNYRP